NDSISLRTQNGHFLMARNGGGAGVEASARLAREWETFTLEAAGLHPIAFSAAPTTPRQAGYPLPSARVSVTGNRKLNCFVIGFRNSSVDSSISTADLRSFFFGSS